MLHEDDTDMWFMVDFGGETTLSALRLAWGSTDTPYVNSYARQYAVQVNDADTAEGWRTIATVTDGTLETRLITFEPVSARYLRIQVLEKSDRYASMRELYAYKTSADTPEAAEARDELKKQIAAPIDETKYTDESMRAYKAALADANALLERDDATYEALSAAVTLLKTTLVEKSPVDRTALAAAIENAVTDLTPYTDKSAQAYAAALANAVAVNAKADATQEEINAAFHALTLAKAALTTRAVVSYGDVNNDNTIDTADAVLVLQRAAGLIGDADLNRQAADVNGDNTVDTADAVLILQKAAELIDRFPVE